MEEIASINHELPQANKIGNIRINYFENDKPSGVIPIVRSNGEVLLLVEIMGYCGRSRLIVQDLNGNVVKELLKFGYEFGQVTADDQYIYVFTCNTETPMYYVFDKNTFEKRFEKPIGPSWISSVCCDGNYVYTYDTENGNLQKRDKKGTVLNQNYASHEYVRGGTKLYSTSQGIQYVLTGNYRIPEDYKKICTDKYGDEFMDLNNSWEDIALDEKTQTRFISAHNVILVAKDDKIEGIIYCPDRNILRISVDQQIGALLISAHNDSEKKKEDIFYSGGVLEILPIDMIPERMKWSDAVLTERYKNKRIIKMCHEIVDESNGDINKIIERLESLINKRGIETDQGKVL